MFVHLVDSFTHMTTFYLSHGPDLGSCYTVSLKWRMVANFGILIQSHVTTMLNRTQPSQARVLLKWCYIIKLDCSSSIHTTQKIDSRTNQKGCIRKIRDQGRKTLGDENLDLLWLFLCGTFSLLFSKYLSRRFPYKNSQRRIRFASSDTRATGSQVLLRCLGSYRNWFFSF